MKKQKTINIHDCIHYTIFGTWSTSVYKNGMVLFRRVGIASWKEAAADTIDYCIRFGREFNDITPEWEKYFNDCQDHLERMMAKKPEVVTPGCEWSMSFSMDAPNKPNYTRANND